MVDSAMNDKKLISRLANLSPQQREALLKQIKKNKSQSGDVLSHAITPCNREADTFPLSFAQQRLWFIDQFQAGSANYNISAALKLKGGLDVEALKLSFQEIVKRHEILRTVFFERDGQGKQQIMPPQSWEIATISLETLSADEQEDVVNARFKGDIHTAFDLELGPLIRARLFRLRADTHVLILTMHHIVFDGWSMGIFIREMTVLYDAFSKDKPSPLDSLPIQYVDYAEWQRNWLVGERLQRQITYWKSKLDGCVALELPTDYPRPAVLTHTGDRVYLTIDDVLTERIRQLARDKGVTLFMILFAAMQTLLYRYSGQSDICMGTPIAGRTKPELEHLIGCFVNTLAIRSDLSGNPSFIEFLKQVQQNLTGAYDHQDIPFERLVDELNVARDLSHTPLFQVLFVLQNAAAINELSLPGLSIEMLPELSEVAKFDLSVVVRESSGLLCEWEYRTDLYKPQTIQQMARHLRNTLVAICEQPDIKICDISLLDPVEENQLLVDWNNTAADYERDSSIIDVFSQQVMVDGSAVALLDGARSITYEELDQLSAQVCTALLVQQDGAGKRIGLCLDRCANAIIGMLGILKAGSAYVPLDPSYPAERLDYMIKDADCHLIIGQRHLLERLPLGPTHLTVDIEELLSSESNGFSDSLIPPLKPESPAYVMYTSGSTGKPKGIEVTHRNILRFTRNTNYMTLDDSVVFLQYAPLSFDACNIEIWGPLLNGGRLVVAPPGAQTPEALGQLMRDTRVNSLWLTTALFHYFAEFHIDELAGLTQLVTGGDVVAPKLARKVIETYPDLYFVNGYGPTENTSFTTFFPISLDSDISHTVPIGKPLSNTKVYILDQQLKPVPVGVVGELYTAGDGVANGYINRPDLTAAAFLDNPFKIPHYERIYKTGDLVRYRADGNIEFISRVDHQVKIRGFRIEMGEIENAIDSLASIRHVKVIVREDVPQVKRLVAYFVPQADCSPTSKELRNELKKLLPDYMIPSFFVAMAELPITANGKLDTRALPQPEMERDEQTRHLEPSSEKEQILAEIWRQVLNLSEVGVRDNFFEVGGDSILSIQIVSRAKQAGLHLTTKQLFENQTIEDLAQVASEIESVVLAEQGLISGNSLLTPVQHWFFEKKFSDVNHWNQSVLFEVDPDSGINKQLLHETFTRLVQHHDALRARFCQSEQGIDVVYPTQDEQDNFVFSQWELAEHEQPEKAVAYYCNESQKSLRLDTGPLVAVTYITQVNSNQSWLAIVVHHLVIDGVSWRILLEDMLSIINQLKARMEPVLPPKTTAFHQWANCLKDAVVKGLFNDDLEYWQRIINRQQYQIPFDFPKAENQDTAIAQLSRTLGKDATNSLLRELHSAYRTEINDLLLTALVRSMTDWSGHPGLYLDLEGHGREDIHEAIDLSRTVGWFTTIFPVWLSYDSGLSIAENIKSIKEQLRRIPAKGMGFGCLRYLGDDYQRQSLTNGTSADIAFNYLGQFDAITNNSEGFKVSPLSRGAEHGPENAEPHVISINAHIANGQLLIDWNYRPSHFSQETVHRLADRYVEALTQIINHCRLPDSFGYTPSDFPLAKLDQGQLDRLIGWEKHVEAVYPLSPMQEGMLFHSLFDNDDGVYFEQLSVELIGSVDKHLLKESWAYVINRHPALRSAFVWQDSDRPVQIVHKSIELEITEMNWQFLLPHQEAERLESWLVKDRERGFEFGRPGLMRLTWIDMPGNRVRLIWSFHHIVLDGWSLPLVMGEIFSVYGCLSKNNPISLPAPGNYLDFIAYLEKTDKSDALQFWKLYLDGFESATPLPNKRPQNTLLEHNYYDESFRFDGVFTNRMLAFARENRVTLNTLVQAAWGILLARYSGENDIVFGTTVSGRPADLPNVENIVGLFINTLPLRIRLDEHTTLVPLLESMQEQQVNLRRFEYTPLVDIQRHSSLVGDRNLFESILVFENYPISDAVQNADQLLDFGHITTIEHTNFPLTVIVEPAEQLHIRLSYDGALFSQPAIQRVLEHFKNLLHGMLAQPDVPLLRLPMLSDRERNQIIHEWNPKPANYPRNLTITQIFERHAKARPNSLALIEGEREYTYQELNSRANQLAHFLAAQRVTPGSFVALALPRCADMVIATLATLKAGATYVPIDPEYPIDRIDHIIRDSGCISLLSLMVYQERLEQLDNGSQLVSGVFYLDQIREELHQLPIENTFGEHSISPSRAAYAMYTSGSTGLPKGVLISQLAVIRLVLDTNYISIQPGDRVCHLSNVAFDAATFDIWAPLLNGATTVIFTQDQLLTPHLFLAERDRTNANITFLTVALFNMYLTTLPEIISRFKVLIVGGDQLDPVKVRKALKYYSPDLLVNGYGPTENTTFSTTYVITSLPEEAVTVPVGRSISGSTAYVLDKYLQPVPIGVNGELYLGGDGVAIGYINDPEKNEKSFFPNPFTANSRDRIYKSGDIARYNDAGQIEVLGRSDDQVKIRGYRIQLSEIETHLARIDGVVDAVVLVSEISPSQKQLVAYVIVDQKIVDLADLRQKAQELLPKQMVPSYFVALEAFPLTKNGKVDKRLLPAPQVDSHKTLDYVAPRNEKEQLLVTVWQEVLRADTVGVKDNFFDLGGDSILSIQIISRAKRLGLQISAKQIFDNQTIAELAEVARELHEVTLAEQGEVIGDIPMLPVQHWFFEQYTNGVNRFNQSILLQLSAKIDVEQVAACWRSILEHHDVLRSRFYQSEDKRWHQEICTVAAILDDPESAVRTVDLSGLPENLRSEQIEHLSDNAQSELDITKGPIFKIIFFDLGEDDAPRLLVILHHLVVDVFSWRVLLEDLQVGITMQSRGSKVDLGAKTTSVRQWADTLVDLAENEYFEADLSYWQNLLCEEIIPLPTDREESNTVADSATVEQVLDADSTHDLLKLSNRAYRTEINDLLLTALGRTLCRWLGAGTFQVDLEGHGREELLETADVSRTVGWFTSIFPVVLTIEENQSLGDCIKITKEALRAIPHKGLSYSVLKYLHPDHAATFERPASTISFNYLGQLDQALENSQSMALAQENPGQEIADNIVRPYLLEVSAKVLNGELVISWRFGGKQFSTDTIRQLAQNFVVELRAIVEHCTGGVHSGYTPSDFPLTGLNQKEIDQWLPANNVETVLPLSPVQAGMLFHALYEPGSWVYFDQVIVPITGSVNESALISAWELVVSRHQILRTAFLWEGLQEPLQVVFNAAPLEWLQYDWTDRDMVAAERSLQEAIVEDRNRGFNFRRPGIMRLAWAKMPDNSYRLVWSFHHVILDGWSMPVIFRELFYAYDQINSGLPVDLAQAPRYEDFIRWLVQRTKSSSYEFWRHYLSGFMTPNVLPIKQSDAVIRRLVQSEGAAARYAEQEVELSESIHSRLISIAKQHRLTVNHLIQGVWAVLLHRYSGDSDIVFGATVSGRPPELPGVELMTGLFINTLPIRMVISGDVPFIDWLAEQQASLKELKNYEHSSLVEVQKQSELAAKQPLFESIVVFENYPIDDSLEQSKASLNIGQVGVFQQTNFPLTLIVIPGSKLSLRLSYDSFMYSEASIRRLIGHLDSLIHSIQRNPKTILSELNLLTHSEREHWLHAGQSVASNPDRNQHTLIELFNRGVQLHPNRIACEFDHQIINYEELAHRSDRMALAMKQAGIQAGDRVALCFERSLMMVVATLATIKIGATYVPLDPEFPTSRLSHILEDSAARLLLSATALGMDPESCPSSCQLATYEALMETIPFASVVAVNQSSLQQLAYVIYTSGTTGQPKGVCVGQEAILRLVNQPNYVSLPAGVRMGHASNVAFDAATFEIWGALLNQGTLVGIGKSLSLDADAMSKVLLESKVEVLFVTTALFNALSSVKPDVFRSLKYCLFGGEMCDIHQVRRVSQTANKPDHLIHVYGPTENTTFSTWFEVTTLTKEQNTVPIGRGISDTSVFILDKNLQPLPAGVFGEIYLGGRGLAQGYLNQPDMTKEKFIKAPWSSSERLYKTGDLGRFNEEGEVEISGRVDDQVKIRGFRIELGEVEAKIRLLPGIADTSVVVRTLADGTKQLLAYCVTDSTSRSYSRAEWKAKLKLSLPPSMIPNAWIIINSIPLTGNGKVDKSQFPDPTSTDFVNSEFVAPRNEIETKLVSIWTTLLKQEQVGIYDDFFDLGGHSLLVNRLASRIKLEIGVDLPLRTLFELPTIAGVAEVIAVVEHSSNESVVGDSDQDFEEGAI